MLSAVLMFQRLRGAIRHAAKEENFAAVFGAAITLVVIGTVTYSLAEGWNLADSFYFAVCTLTTSSIADPSLELTSAPIRVFTALYVLVGIGILVELVRRLGFGFMKMREEQKATREAERETNGAPESG